MLKLFLLVVLVMYLDVCVAQTPAPTPNSTVPGVATLRPTVPTMPPIMMPDSDRGNPENKTEELPIVAVYFIMLGVSFVFTGGGIAFSALGYDELNKRQRQEVNSELW